MASAEAAGELRLMYDNAARSNPTEAFLVPTVRVSAGALNPSDYSTLTYRPRVSTPAWVDEGGYIILEMKGAAAATVESEESNMRLPIVLRNKKTGAELRRVISTNDLDAFKNSGTDDVVLSTTKFTELGKYTIPQGHFGKIDSGDVFHAYVGDNQ
jgi:hypothetical protein